MQIDAFQPAFAHGGEHFFILARGDAAGELGVRRLLAGGVLPHQGEVRLRAEGGEGAHDAHAVVGAEGEDEVAHDAARHHAFPVEADFARRHELHGGEGDIEVVRFPRIPFRDLRGKVFEVGQVHVDVSVYRAQRFGLFVGMGVVDDGYFRAVDGERRGKLRDIVGGGHEIDIRRSHFLQLAEDARKLLRAVLFSDCRAGDLMVLAEHAAQGAAGKEYRSRPRPAGDAGFLVGVQPVFRHARVQPAAAGALCFFSVCPAVYGAERAGMRHKRIVPHFRAFEKRYAASFR